MDFILKFLPILKIVIIKFLEVFRMRKPIISSSDQVDLTFDQSAAFVPFLWSFSSVLRHYEIK